MELITKDQVRWVNKMATVGEVSFSGHVGVTKLINYGKPSFKEMMIAQHGQAKAEEIVNKSRSRGDKSHAKLETKAGFEEIIPVELREQLGEQLGSEVFVHGSLFNAKVIGFVDAIFKRADGTIVIVDYKTKSRPYYKQDLSTYWKQLICYAMLLDKMYSIGILNIELSVILIYSDGSPVDSYYQKIDGYAKMLAKEIQATTALYLQNN